MTHKGERMNIAKKALRLDTATLSALFGSYDSNIKKIEKLMNVNIVNRDEDLLVYGSEQDSERAAAVITKLVAMIESGSEPDEQSVNYLSQAYGDADFDKVDKLAEGQICLTVSGKPIKPKTLGQQRYVDEMRKKTIVFGVGPAGTGKTYLAMAMAVTAFKRNEVSRIIMTRPAIEAGEKLGFLPGDLQQKVDPYLRPLYDALHEIMGSETFLKHMEKGVIEVAPLAYMRGRTLDNAYIVLDEAQNTTPEQMKMFLTRLGFGSRAVITGDLTQIDLGANQKSGLTDALETVRGIEEIGTCMLSGKDVVRHPLVQKIVDAYDKRDAAAKARQRQRGGPGIHHVRKP
jgi:phosphate starvation-inducible PhoH-like protein